MVLSHDQRVALSLHSIDLAPDDSMEITVRLQVFRHIAVSQKSALTPGEAHMLTGPTLPLQ